MKVTFTKTHAKGYSVTVEDAGGRTLTMDPAPGYDDRLPHDVAHLIVENELGIVGGVFKLLAARGSESHDSRSHRKAKRRSDRVAKDNKADLLFSEHAVYAAQSRWEKHEIVPDTKIPPNDIARICERFETFAAEWSQLPIGGAITLEFENKALPVRKR